MTKIQIIRSPSGEELVVLPRADYEALLSAALDEDDEDIALYDSRKAALTDSPLALLPPEVSALLLKGLSRLKAVRQWRGRTQSDLAIAAGIAQGYLSEIESGTKAGAPETLVRIASVLDIPVDWIA